MAQGHGFFSLGARQPSPDHELIAYAMDTVGRRIYDIEIRHIERGDIERGITGASGNLVWAEDGKAIFYTKRDPETLRAYQVWKHTLETPVSRDELVYEETDEEFSCFVSKTRSKRFLMIVSDQTLTSEVRILDATTPDGDWRVVLPREVGHEYSVDHAGEFDQQAVAHCVDNAAAKFRNAGVYSFGSQRTKPCNRAFLIVANKPTVPNNVGSENGRQAALDVRLSHGFEPL